MPYLTNFHVLLVTLIATFLNVEWTVGTVIQLLELNAYSVLMVAIEDGLGTVYLKHESE